MRIFLFLALSFCAVSAFAQDYYLTAGKNKNPLRVKSVEDISEVLKKQSKDKKYKPLILSQNEKEAIYVLLPVSLTVTGENGVFVVSSPKEDFELNISVTDEPEDMMPSTDEEEAEETEKVQISSQNKIYGRIKYTRYDASSSEMKVIALQAPYAGKYVQIAYATNNIATDKSKPVVDKNEAVLGIAASSLNRAVFVKETPKGKPAKIGAENEESVPPLITDWTVNKLTPRGSEINFNIREGETLYPSKIVLAKEYPSAKAEGGRIILRTENDSFMWLEPIYKDSKTYNASILKKYAPGKKFNTPRRSKIKVGDKDINMVRYSALNESTISYFFKEGERRFVLSFIAPSSKLPVYEKSSAEVLRGFNIEQTPAQEEEF